MVILSVILAIIAVVSFSFLFFFKGKQNANHEEDITIMIPNEETDVYDTSKRDITDFYNAE